MLTGLLYDFLKFFFRTLLLVYPSFFFAQLTVTTGIPPATLVQNVLLGSGVTVSNVTFVGDPNQIGYFNGSASNIGINEGIILSSGNVLDAPGPNNSVNTSTDFNRPGDPDLTFYSGQTTYDAAVLEFDFVPTGDTLRFRYVFASEEYCEFSCDVYNDVFAFLISGPGIVGTKNLALIPSTAIPVTINNVNGGDCSTSPPTICSPYSMYYIDNSSGVTVEYDGFTVVLTAFQVVQPCSTYHIKIAIADAYDHIYDSAVFLEGGSFGSNGVSIEANAPVVDSLGNKILPEGCSFAQFHFQLADTAQQDVVFYISTSGTAVNGVDYQYIPDSVVIPAGQIETYLPIIPIIDSIPESDETLIITILNAMVCGNSSITDTIIIRSVEPLEVTIPSGAVRCGNSTATLTAIPSGGDGPLTFTWQPGGLSGQSIQVAPTTTTTYYVTVKDTCGNEAIDSVTVYVAPNPILSPITPLSVDYCEGKSSVTLGVSASGGTPSYDYVWDPPAPISQQNQPQIQVIPMQSTTYQVYAIDSFGCHSDTLTFTVNYHKAPKLVTSPSDTFVCAETTFPIQAIDTSGLTGLSYQWNPTVGLSNPNSSVTQVTVDTSIVYQVIATDPSSNCSSAPAFVSITVQPLPQANAGPDKTICPGDSVMIGGTPIGSPGTYVYQWSPTTGLSDPTSPNPMASPSSTTLYQLIVSDGMCQSKPDTVKVEVISVPSITPELPSVIRFCPGDSVQLLIDANITGPYQVLWSPSQGLSNPYTLEPYAAPDTEITYYLSIFLPTCSLDSVLSYTLIPLSVAQVEADTSGDVALYCYGEDSITLHGKIVGPYDSFKWLPNQYILNANTLTPTVFPPENQYYYLIVTSNGCNVTDSVLVRVLPSPRGTFSLPQSWVCFGDSIPVTYEVPFSNVTISWFWTEANQPHTHNGNPLWIKGDSSKYYYVIASHNGGECAIEDSIWITTKPSVKARFSASDTRLCTGESTLLEAQVDTNQVVTWWYIEDGPIYSNTLQVIHSFNVPGFYDVMLVVAPADDPTCKDTLIKPNYLIVVERAQAKFASDPALPQNGDSLYLFFPETGVQFYNQSEGQVLYTWWYFGDGDSTQQFNPYHRYNVPGIYQVKLVVEDAGGCRDTIEKGYYVVLEPTPVIIPNVFTPNGDGINDYLEIDYNGVETFQLQIFDAWGNLVFSTSSPNEKWDGRLPSGKEALEGTYYYVCKVGTKLYKGHITLIR